MSLRFSGLQYSSVLVRVAAIAGVAGVHLAVVAAIWASASHDSDPEMPEVASIQFVEISQDFVDTMPAESVPQVAMAPTPPSSVAESEPEPEVVPEPEIVPEPEPLPEPVPEPEMVAPEPKPQPKPVPKPASTPKPKLEPKPQPAPTKPRPNPQPGPQPTAVPAPAEPVAAASPSGQASAPTAPKAPVAQADPNAPRFISQVDYAGLRPVPEYPRASVRRGETGRVLVRVLISPSGSVQEASVRKSSGHSRLDEAAVKAAKTARFKPYIENGVARPALADIPFDFVL